MAVDLEKYRKKEPVPGAAPTPVDVNKYRKPAPGAFTFDVPIDPAKASQQRLQDARNDQVQYDQEASKGFMSRFGKALVKNLVPSEVGLGKTIAGILYQGSKADKGLQDSIAEGENIKVKLLKQIRENEQKGIDTTRLKEAYNNQQKVGEKTTKTARDLVQLPTTGQAVGQIGGTALDLLTAGTYSRAKTGAMATGSLFRGSAPAVKTLATAAGVPELGVLATQKAGGIFSLRGARNIATGATTGYASDVALGLQGERGTERDGAAAFIPGLGTALGTAIPTLSEGVQTVRNIANPQPRIVEKRLSALRDLETKNGKIARVFDAADRKGIDVRKTLSETNLLNGAVDADGRISSDKALNNFNEFIAPYEGRVKEALTAEGRSIQLNQLADEAKSFIDNSTLSDRQKVELQKEIADNLDAFQEFRGRAVPVTAVHDTKVVLASANNYLNPSKNIVDKEAARFFKEVVEKNTSSLDVKAYNGELSKYYTVREALEAMDRAVVSGGRMGKYFSSVIGAGVGGLAGGPIGAIAGAEAGAMARGSQLSRALGSNVKKGMEATPELLDAMKPTAVGRAAIPDVVIGGKKPVVPDVTIPKATAKDFFANKGLMESLKDQGGYARNPLGKGETSLQRVARIRESSAKINRLNPKALDIIEQFVDFQAGKFDTVGEPKVLRENIDVIAKELGFTEQGPKLADRFREVLDARMDKATRGARMLPVGKVEDAGKKAGGYFHGGDLSKASSENTGMYGNGLYITNDMERAKDYGSVNKVNLDGLNLFESKDTLTDLFGRDTNYGDSAKITQKYKAQGFDGIRVVGKDGAEEIVVFDPKKVKSGTSVGKVEGATPATTDLVQEAKKYKSADEFVKAQGVVVYRGQNQPTFSLDSKRPKAHNMKGTSFSREKGMAEAYSFSGIGGGKQPTIIEATIPENKILKFEELPFAERIYIKKELSKMSEDDIVEGSLIENIMDRMEPYSKLMGKEAVDVQTFTNGLIPEIRVWDDSSSFKTRTQLEDFWKQANR